MASYKGAISFGLVYIPISFSVSVKENNIGFNMIDKKTMSRIKYKKTCVDCKNAEVKKENIVKGYKYEKDKYVIFTDKDFEKLKTKNDKNIDIIQFVDLKEVDPIYFDRTYYVTPLGSEKAFNVLLLAMEKQNKAGLAKSVMGNKETLILIRVQNGKMLATTLYFYNEIQKMPEIKKTKTDTKEIKLAMTLIDQMTAQFKPEKFKDEYYEKIKKAIKQKIAGKEIVETKEVEENVNIINLIDALNKSLKINKKENVIKLPQNKTVKKKASK